MRRQQDENPSGNNGKQRKGPKPLSKEEFIERAEDRFGNKFTFEFPHHFNSKSNIIVKCQKHGGIEHKALSFLKSPCGCKKCGLELREQNKFSENEEARIKSFKKIHADKYEYPEGVRVENGKLKIKCKEHGEFFQHISSHLNGSGCPHCSKTSLEKRKERFIKEANVVHKGRYSYEKVVYLNSQTKVQILCDEHGFFLQSPNNHLNKHGCPSCSKNRIKSKEELEEDLTKLYGERVSILNYAGNVGHKYLFELDNGKKITTKSLYAQLSNRKSLLRPDKKIESLFRGRLRQILKNNKNGQTSFNFLGCNREDFIKFIEIQGYSDDKQIDHCYPCAAFDFSNQSEALICFNWRNHNPILKLENTAKKDKILEKYSHYKQKIKFLLEMESFFSERIEIKKLFILGEMWADWFFPSRNIAIKFYNPVECNGKKISKEKRLFRENGIRLIQVFDSELIKNKKLVLSRIKSILGLTKGKIYARKCVVAEISSKKKNDFLRKYHIQSEDKSNTKLGLFYRKRLVAVMTFSKARIALGQKNKEEVELSRYCSVGNFSVIGGAGKLLSYFKNKVGYNGKVISFCDLRWNTGDVYKKIGFSYVKTTKENYFYIDSKNPLSLKHRFNYAKHNLKKILPNFDPSLTEKENCERNGLKQLYDSGSEKYALDWN